MGVNRYSYHFTEHLPAVEILEQIYAGTANLETLLQDVRAQLAFRLVVASIAEEANLVFEQVFVQAVVSSPLALRLLLSNRGACRALVHSTVFLDAVVANSTALTIVNSSRFLAQAWWEQLAFAPAIERYAQFVPPLVETNLLALFIQRRPEILRSGSFLRGIWDSDAAIAQISPPAIREHFRSHPNFFILTYNKPSNNTWNDIPGLTGRHLLLGWSSNNAPISYPFELQTLRSGSNLVATNLHSGSTANTGTDARQGSVLPLEAPYQLRTPVDSGWTTYYLALLPVP